MANRSIGYIAAKFWSRVLPNLRHLVHSRVRTCRACRRLTLFLAIGEAEEFHICVRCRANLRYELLADHLHKSELALGTLDVLELDPDSPLRPILGRARRYIRSFFRPHVPPGTVRDDGVVCQDITSLTYSDASLDLIVSSDVLEHVPNPESAFAESARVLRPGGSHIFTVPPRDVTRQRAALVNGTVNILIAPPEYHQDPLDPAGVLVFWDYGPDLPTVFRTHGLQFRIVAGPEGASRRTVWEAKKV